MTFWLCDIFHSYLYQNWIRTSELSFYYYLLFRYLSKSYFLTVNTQVNLIHIVPHKFKTWLENNTLKIMNGKTHKNIIIYLSAQPLREYFYLFSTSPCTIWEGNWVRPLFPNAKKYCTDFQTSFVCFFFSPGSIIQWYYLYKSVDSDLEKNTNHQIGLINGKGNINSNQGTPFDTTWFFLRYI